MCGRFFFLKMGFPASLSINGETQLQFKSTSRKRKDSNAWKRYEAYKKARTLNQFLEFGGDMRDLSYDWDRGLVSVFLDQQERTRENYASSAEASLQILNGSMFEAFSYSF